jgi:hypothetical protein
MKTFLTVAALATTIALSWTAVAATSDDPMAEMKNCAVCKVMMEKPDLMESMTWECHKVDAGMLCLMSVPKDMKKTYDEIHQKMMENVKAVKAAVALGKEVELCHFCTAMGDLEKAGAKSETIETKTGSIHLVTAADPAVVAKIHAHADEAIAQQKAMESGQQ